MIARRERDDAALFFFRRQRLNLVRRAADLERARALKVFTLEENFLAGDVIELSGGDYRSAMNAVRDAFPRFVDRLNIQHRKRRQQNELRCDLRRR